MAKFNVTKAAYRNGQHLQPGETFSIPPEECDKHCDSIALEPADDETIEEILVFAPESKKAKAILDGRKKVKEDAEKHAKLAALSAQAAAKKATDAAAAAAAAAKK